MKWNAKKNMTEQIACEQKSLTDEFNSPWTSYFGPLPFKCLFLPTDTLHNAFWALIFFFSLTLFRCFWFNLRNPEIRSFYCAVELFNLKMNFILKNVQWKMNEKNHGSSKDAKMAILRLNKENILKIINEKWFCCRCRARCLKAIVCDLFVYFFRVCFKIDSSENKPKTSTETRILCWPSSNEQWRYDKIMINMLKRRAKESKSL